jgi:hypothetical protein
MTVRSAQGWEVCSASARRLDGPNTICRTPQVIREGFLLCGYHHHDPSLAYRLDDRHEVAVSRHQDGHLKEAAESANEHVYCNKAINTFLLAAAAASNRSHLDRGIGEQFNRSPILFHIWIGQLVGASVVKKDACQANRDTRGAREFFRGRLIRSAPRLNQLRISNVVGEQARVRQGSVKLLAYPPKVASIKKAVGVHNCTIRYAGAGRPAPNQASTGRHRWRGAARLGPEALAVQPHRRFCLRGTTDRK